MILRVCVYECKEAGSIKHSALFNLQQRAGASFTEIYGWEVPASYHSPDLEVRHVRSGVGLADVSWTVKLDLKGFAVKKGLSLGQGVFCWGLGPLHSLATCDPSVRDGLMDRVKAFRVTDADLSLPLPVYVTDVTSVYAQFLLAGPQSREVLRKLSSLNVSEGSFPDWSCGQSNLAHVRAIILRQDLGLLPAFHLLVGRDYGESVWEAVMHGGREFEIAPFGLEALKLLSVPC